MIETWEAILPILRSPCCAATLIPAGEALSCSQCQQSYRENQGILVLLPPDTASENPGEEKL